MLDFHEKWFSYRLKIALLCAFLVLFHLPNFGQQTIWLSQIYGQFSPNISFDKSVGETDLHEFGFRLRKLKPLDEDNILVPGIFVEFVDSKLSPLHKNITQLYTMSPRMTLERTYSDKWTGSYMVIPRLSSDIKGLGLRDFQLGSLLLWKYTQRKHKKYQFGLYANTDLFGPLVLPLYGIYYLSESQKFEVDILLPVTAELNYRLRKNVRLGISFWAKGTSFNLHEYGKDKSGYYLEKRSADLLGFIEFPFRENWFIQFMLGHSFGRIQEVYKKNDKVKFALGPIKIGDDREQVNVDVDDGILFKFRMLYRISLAE